MRFCGYIRRYTLRGRRFPCAPVSSLARRAVWRLSADRSLMFTDAKTSSRADSMEFTVIAPNVIVSNWSLRALGAGG